ncbi:MAG TPA: aldehyde dehydrogenase family protein, partial [Polyangiaceae bacterium]|nr:aldehyde dehydrogenase family protein [Polyangiaceae bacterium]
MSSVVPEGALHVASRRVDRGAALAVREPWTGDELAKVVLADEGHAEEATVAAEKAFAAMQALTSFERKALLGRIAQGIEARKEAFAELLAREAGKPIAMAEGEVARAVSTFALAAEEATRILGEVMPLDVTAKTRGYSGSWTRVAAGPVVAIAPFNFPLNLVAHKIAPALACGCSIVLKPAPQTPLSALLLAECIRHAGAPDDAVQVLPCEVPVAERLVRDDRFATLSFTGSAKVGWQLKALAGKKRVLLELGGNAATLVHDDAPLDDACGRIVAGAFGYAGQVCIKVQRLYLHRPIAAAFVEKLVARARAIEPRSPMDAAAVCGPMIDEGSAKRVVAWVGEATRDPRVRLLCGGKREGNRSW